MKAIYKQNSKNLEFSSEEELVEIIRENDMVIASHVKEKTNFLLTYENNICLNSTYKGEVFNLPEEYSFVFLASHYDIFVFSDKEFYRLVSGE